MGSWRGLGQTTMPSTALAYAPDGRRLAVSLAKMSTASGTLVADRLLLIDADSGRPVWRRGYPVIPGQAEAHLVFRADGALISSAQQGETLLWDTQAGRIVRRYAIGGRLALSPDAATGDACAAAGRSRVHDLRGAARRHRGPWHTCRQGDRYPERGQH